MHEETSFRARSRAHSLLLSAAGMPIKAIAKTSQVHRVTVSTWLKHWAQHGAQSVHDQPRSGRPTTLSPTAQAIALQYSKEQPPSRQGGVKRFADTTDTRLRLSSLKRRAKKARRRWQRVRQSLQSLRDPAAFTKAKRALDAWQQQEDHGHIALSSCDASGLTLAPTLPSAWPEPQGVSELPARQSGRSNVLGLMNRQNALQPLLCEDSIPTGVVLACCDALCHTLTKQTVVIIDNASIHTSEAVEDRIPSWKKPGLSIKSLPPYSPALHLIAILWRRITYTWLPFSAYECLNALSEALETILSHVGSEYQITFA